MALGLGCYGPVSLSCVEPYRASWSSLGLESEKVYSWIACHMKRLDFDVDRLSTRGWLFEKQGSFESGCGFQVSFFQTDHRAKAKCQILYSQALTGFLNHHRYPANWLSLFLSLSYSVLLSIRQDFNGSTTLIATAYPSGTLMVLLSVFFVDLM